MTETHAERNWRAKHVAPGKGAGDHKLVALHSLLSLGASPSTSGRESEDDGASMCNASVAVKWYGGVLAFTCRFDSKYIRDCNMILS